ncbi:TPA: CO dehydrogenase/acetyl-CoA synthase complex subunit epsilon [Candidatus Bathyarchaeota archaeon]|nr:CO dehydrogenase/acetyl-CoA synthase complex subunit epsilon [Candidatus Bathyarchaeota archaeon]
MAEEAWTYGCALGRTKGLLIRKPEMVAAMVRKARRPIMVVGREVEDAELDDGRKATDYVADVARSGDIPVVTSAYAYNALVERGVRPAAMSLVEIIDRLQDPGWKGLDGKGQYDLALFVGAPYHMLSQALSSLRHFAPRLTTISIDRYFHPNAKWSLPNASPAEWREGLASVARALRGHGHRPSDS